MARVSSQSTIRNTITLSDDEWQTVLSLMTGPCTISQMVKAGIERHTAEIVRVKILSAIVQEQQTVGLANNAEMVFETVPDKQKRAKTTDIENEKGWQIAIAADGDGHYTGTILPEGSILKYENGGYVSEYVDDWLSEHGVNTVTVLDPGNHIEIAWHGFISTFRSVTMKYLNEYLQWFCFLRQQEMIGKSKLETVFALWQLLSKYERTLTNRNFRSRSKQKKTF